MDMETIWKHCMLCDAHFPSDQYQDHLDLWHSKKNVSSEDRV